MSRDLDDVIGVLGQAGQLQSHGPRDRDILNDDISRLREYREQHADWDRDR